MPKTYRVGSLLALGVLTALPACSLFGGGRERASTSSPQYSQNTYQQQQHASVAIPPPSSVPPGAAVAPVSRDTIREVQQKLADSGEYHARVDGVWGPQTERAVRDWQSKNNLTANGMLDAQTLQAMNIASNTGAANNPNNPNSSTNPNTGPNAPSQASTTPYPADQGAPPPTDNNPNPNAGIGTRAR